MPKITATVVGNVVSKKELKEFGTKGEDSENYVLNFRIAAQDSHFDRDAKEWKDDEPNFNSVTVWGKKARNVAASIEVGNPVVIQGFLKMKDAWTNKDDEEMPPQQYIEAITVGIDVCAYSGESHRKPKGGASSNSNDSSGKSSDSAKSSSKTKSAPKETKKDSKKDSDDFDLDLDLDLDTNADEDPGF